MGHSKKLLLLGMSAIKLSGIDINYHIDESFEGRPSALQFKQGSKHSKVTHGRVECYEYRVEKENTSPCDIYRNSDNYPNTTLYDEQDNKVLMTEIQLKNIVDRLGKETVTGTDGDEFTIKDGNKVSKFSKEAIEIGFDVTARNPRDCGPLHTRNNLTMVTNQKTRASRTNHVATDYI